MTDETPYSVSPYLQLSSRWEKVAASYGCHSWISDP